MDHEDSHGAVKGKRLGLSVPLTLVFIAGEAGVGFLSNSLALLADAGHNFADALNLLLAWYAIRLSRRPPNDRKTFGHHRATILAALLNAVSLVVMAGWIFWEALHRLMSPPPVESSWMVGVGLAAADGSGLWYGGANLARVFARSHVDQFRMRDLLQQRLLGLPALNAADDLGTIGVIDETSVAKKGTTAKKPAPRCI